jgi:hypothetical protein
VSDRKPKQMTILTEIRNDPNGERILAIGQYNRIGPWVGLPMGLIGLFSSIYFLRTKSDSISQTMPFLDIIILVSSIYAIYYSIRELMLFRHRAVTLTENRLYGHDGRQAFDLPLNEIRSVSEETTKSFFAGTQTFIVIKATKERLFRLEQLKDLKLLQQAIREAREKARHTVPASN